MLLPTRCPLCTRPGPSPCATCAARLPPARASPYPAVLAYAGDARRLIHALKYRNGRAVAGSLGVAMADLVGPGAVDVVTWAPTAPRRRRARGYDQAEVLARAVGRQLGVPVRSLLRRTDRAGPQTGRRRAERLALAPAFVAVGRVAGRVLVVDDVVTTGATLHAASAALLAGGARTVLAVAAAATPRPRSYTREPATEKEQAWTSRSAAAT